MQGTEDPIEGKADCWQLEESKADDGLETDQEFEIPSQIDLNKVLAVRDRCCGDRFWWTDTLPQSTSLIFCIVLKNSLGTIYMTRLPKSKKLLNYLRLTI